MKPILFAENSTSFTSNGIGRLDAISCKVTEERNGIYELDMEIAQSSKYADSIGMNSIICAIPSDGASLQPFRVYKITKPINGKFKVYAQHISYQLSLIPAMPFSITASSSACASALAGLKSNAVGSCPFMFWTDVTTVSSYTQTVPASIRSRLGGVEGSVLDQFGGEYEFDNYTVKLHRYRGVQTPSVTLRYGKNITDLNQEENISNVITGIVPYWSDLDGANIVTLPEKVVESSTASQYPFKRTIPYDFSSAFEEAPTVAQLRAKAQAYVNQSGVGVPEVSIKLSFINLADTEEYKDIAPMQSVKLCDVIGVYFEKYGINTTAKVVKTVYDVLAERYESIEIGSLRSGLAAAITDQNNLTATKFAETSQKISQVNANIGEAVDNATAWLTASDGYVVAVKNTDGSWKEILFLDTNDTTTAHNVLRINQNGIGFSRSGVGGPYTQAWTLDGRLVVGGTNVPSITVYDSNNNIVFQASATAMIWNANNSSMDAQGVITATGATLENATLTNNGSNNILKINNGGLSITDANGNVKASLTALYTDGVIGLHETGNMLIIEASETLSMQGNDFISLLSDGTIYMSTGADIYLNATNGVYSNADIDINTHKITGDTPDGAKDVSDTSGYVDFNTTLDGRSHNTRLNGDAILLDTNRLVTRTTRGSGTYSVGANGQVITALNSDNIYYSAVDDLTINHDSEEVPNMLWDVTVRSDGTIAEYRRGSFYFPNNFRVAGTTHVDSVVISGSTRNTRNGLVVL